MYQRVEAQALSNRPRCRLRISGLALWQVRHKSGTMVTPGGLEPPAYGLGNRRSILLSYGVTRELLPHLPSQFQTGFLRNKARPCPFSAAKGQNPIWESPAIPPQETNHEKHSE